MLIENEEVYEKLKDELDLKFKTANSLTLRNVRELKDQISLVEHNLESKIEINGLELQSFKKDTNKRFDKLEVKVDNLENHMNQKFDEVDKRFEAVDKRFEAVDKRFEEIDKRFDTVDKRFEEVDKRFDRLEAKVDKLDEKFDKFTSFMTDAIKSLNR